MSEVVSEPVWKGRADVRSGQRASLEGPSGCQKWWASQSGRVERMSEVVSDPVWKGPAAAWAGCVRLGRGKDPARSGSGRPWRWVRGSFSARGAG
jgi:hypothetical protein